MIRRAALGLLVLMGIGCSDDSSSGPETSGTRDGGPDAHIESGSSDAGNGSPRDAGPGDAGLDASGAPDDDDAGTDAGGDAGDAGDVTQPSPIDGKLAFRSFDAPVATARVDLGGSPEFDVTDSKGKFALPSVPPSYDLTVHYVSGTTTSTERFVGLTTRTPILESGASDGSIVYKATLSGTITGVADPIPTGEVVRVFARTRAGGGGTGQAIRTEGQSPTFSITLEWVGGATRSIIVHAIHYTIPPSSGLPTEYHHTAKLQVSAQDGVNQASLVLALKALGQVSVTGTIDPPDFANNLIVQMNYGTRTTDGSWSFNGDATAAFALVAPKLGDAMVYVKHVGTLASGTIASDDMLATDAMSLDFTRPSSEPTLTAPMDMATFAAEQTFSWKAPADGKGVYRLELAPRTGTGPTFFATTSETSVKLPSSFVPKAASTYAWRVRYFPYAESVDALAGAEGWSLAPTITTKERHLTVP